MIKSTPSCKELKTDVWAFPAAGLQGSEILRCQRKQGKLVCWRPHRRGTWKPLTLPAQPDTILQQTVPAANPRQAPSALHSPRDAAQEARVVHSHLKILVGSSMSRKKRLPAFKHLRIFQAKMQLSKQFVLPVWVLYSLLTFHVCISHSHLTALLTEPAALVPSPHL